MRYIFLMMMLTGMLFSAGQKQIILGSFSIESNALFYSIDAQKKIDEDYRLKAMIEKHALKVEYKQVGDYTVVTIYPFDNYPSLFETIDLVKHYYPKAYAINYPAFASGTKEVVIEEPIVEEAPLVEEEPEVIEEVEVQAKVVTPVEDEIKYEPTVVKKPTPVPAPMPMMVEEEALPMMDLLLLAVLLLVVIGFVVYKIKMKKKEEEEF